MNYDPTHVHSGLSCPRRTHPRRLCRSDRRGFHGLAVAAVLSTAASTAMAQPAAGPSPSPAASTQAGADGAPSQSASGVSARPSPTDRASGEWTMPSTAGGGRPPPAYPAQAERGTGWGHSPNAPAASRPTPGPIANSQPDQAEAETQDEEEERSWALDVTATTIVPLSVGGQVSLEIPGRILLGGDVGWMPPGYGAAINGLVQSFGAYDPAIGALVEGAFDGAVVARATAGWRPFPSAGFEITGGYAYVGISGGLSVADVANATGNGQAQNLVLQGYDAEVTLSSALHNFHVALGWRWVVWDHLLIRASLGYMQTVASSSTVEIPGHPDVAAAATGPADAILSEVYESYVKLPFLALSAGARF